MSRKIVQRWELRGNLIADAPVHVGGLDAGPPSLTQARDGLHRPMLPGTALAGVIRAALNRMSPTGDWLWGPVSGRDEHGRDDATSAASWVRVDDAPAPGEPVAELREHVSIDRINSTAARGHLFTREVLPAGTRFEFRMVVDDPGGPEAGTLITRVADLLRGPGITIGAAATRGLGQVRLHDAALHRFDLATRAGIIATLRGKGADVTLSPVRPDDLAPGMLRVVIPWRPRGPLAVQVSADGDVVDAFPLTTRRDGVHRLELSGSTIKGVLRSHAERIMRTATATKVPKDFRFLDQMRAVGLGPVAALFGTAADRDADGGVTGRRGALRAGTCVSKAELPAKEWQAVRLLQRRTNNTGQLRRQDIEPTADIDEKRAALARMQKAVDELNGKVKGVRFVITPHVAVDRWTGGAAEGRLFTTLEAHRTDGDMWLPIILDLDVDRLGRDATAIGADENGQAAAVTLLLLVLRDLCDGWIGFGHGTTRGMGAVTVNPDEVRFRAGPKVDWLADLDQRSLTELLDDTDLTKRLMATWPPENDTTNPSTAGTDIGSER